MGLIASYSYPIEGGTRVEGLAGDWQPAPDREPRPEPVHPTLEGVRADLAQAMVTLRAMEARGAFPAQLRSAHPEVIRLATEAYGYDDAEARRRPTPAEISRLDILLACLIKLPRDERLAACAVALGLSLRRIGRQLGVSHECVRTRERGALEKIVKMLVDKTVSF